MVKYWLLIASMLLCNSANAWFSLTLNVHIVGDEADTRHVEQALSQWDERVDFTFTRDEEAEADILVWIGDYGPTPQGGQANCRVTFLYDKTVGCWVFINTHTYYDVPEPLRVTRLTAVILHEIGHTLGIRGHNERVTELMYANTHSCFRAHWAGCYVTTDAVRAVEAYIVKVGLNSPVVDSE